MLRAKAMPSAWFCFYTVANGERAAGEKLGELGFCALVPLEKFKRRYTWRRDEIRERAVFPHYGFVRFDPEQVGMTELLEVREIIGFLISKATLRPFPVPEFQIATLQLADRLGLWDRTKPPGAGVKVEAMQGPFAGHIGKVLRARAKERIEVLFRVFGGDTAVSMPLADLREA